MCWLGFGEWFLLWVGGIFLPCSMLLISIFHMEKELFWTFEDLLNRVVFLKILTTLIVIGSMVIEKWAQYRKNNSKDRFGRNLEIRDLEILFAISNRWRTEILLNWKKWKLFKSFSSCHKFLQANTVQSFIVYSLCTYSSHTA